MEHFALFGMHDAWQEADEMLSDMFAQPQASKITFGHNFEHRVCVCSNCSNTCLWIIEHLTGEWLIMGETLESTECCGAG